MRRHERLRGPGCAPGVCERLGTPFWPTRNAGNVNLGCLFERFALGNRCRLRHRAPVSVNPARGLEEILERSLLISRFLGRYRGLNALECALEASLEAAFFPRKLANRLERRAPLGHFGGSVQQIGP